MSVPVARLDRGPGGSRTPRERLLAALCAVLVTAALGYALILGLSPALIRRAAERVTQLVLLPLPRATSPPSQPNLIIERRSAPASAANLRGRAAPVVALPKPLPQPVQLATAPSRGSGAEAETGSADMAGQGTGAGGQGSGAGSGGEGDGDGGGADVVQISRNLKPSDVPCFKHGECAGGEVHMRFTVGVNGRVTRCVVTRSAGDPELDRETCAAAMQHLRYRPATDAAGRPIASDGDADQRWGDDEQP